MWEQFEESLPTNVCHIDQCLQAIRMPWNGEIVVGHLVNNGAFTNLIGFYIALCMFDEHLLWPLMTDPSIVRNRL